MIGRASELLQLRRTLRRPLVAVEARAVPAPR